MVSVQANSETTCASANVDLDHLQRGRRLQGHPRAGAPLRPAMVTLLRPPGNAGPCRYAGCRRR
jgi:hypothetical protein